MVIGGVFLVRMLLAAARADATTAGLRRGARPRPGAASFRQNRTDAAMGRRAAGRAGAGPRCGRARGGKAVPPGFDAEGFARHAKLQFVRLQAAHDTGDREALGDS